MTLSKLNAAHREFHEASVVHMLSCFSSLTAQELQAARQHWTNFITLLDAHLGIEEQLIFPKAVDLKFPSKTSLIVLENDHKILQKSLDDVVALMDQLEGVPTAKYRAVLVSELSALVRLQRVMEHHANREEELFYPLLEAQLPAELIQEFTQAFQAKMALDPLQNE